MAKTERKPMTFSVAGQTALAEVAKIEPTAREPSDASERQQVGARVTKAKYRQLKSRAALTGATVQALVEQAIDEFLAKGTA